MKKTLSVLLCLAALLSLCACGNSERAEDTELIVLSSEANTMFKKSEEAAFSLNKDFVSDDGLIEISIHDDTVDTIPAAMDVLKVRPKVITSDMAETMAEGLFGNADFYEYSEEINKAEILNLIKACEYGVTDEAIFADYGSDIPNSQIDSIRNARLAILEYYRNAYANARDDISASPCQWKFWPIEHYAFHDFSNTDNSYNVSLILDLRTGNPIE